MYEIIDDMKTLQGLVNSLTDEETGETREVTEEEKQIFCEWINESGKNFEQKFNNICRFYKNLKAVAAVAKAEKDSFKAEMERLSKRAKARENEAERLKGLLRYGMDVFKMSKYKTDLFSAGVQNTQKSIKPTSTFDPNAIPVEFLKRDLAASLVSAAIKEGKVYEKEGLENRTKLFYSEGGAECELKGVSIIQGTALVIR
jgi:hypothetical protein